MTTHISSPRLTRRAVLAGAASAACAVPFSRSPAVAMTDAAETLRLRPGPGKVRLVPAPYSETSVWAYNGSVPGPEIRLRQGGTLRVLVDNGLDEGTTIHWHGIRLSNAMDGVPDLTQPPIAPGGTFVYEFEVPDAGTFWYHPHQRGFEQVGRGLSGALIIEENEPVPVDRDVLWLLDDWRLTRDASISPDFGAGMDMAMAGRIGNTVTVNGQVADRFDVRPGERIRLRLINSANARIFRLNFRGHEPQVVALDGHPVEPYPLPGRLTLGPGERADLIIDMLGEPGERFAVVDNFYFQSRYKLLDLAYGTEPPLRKRRDSPLVRLQPNPVAEPDLARSNRHEIVFGGGMGGMMAGGMRGGMMGGMMGRGGDGTSGMMGGHFWSVNGVSMTGHDDEPLITLNEGDSYVLAMRNSTMFHHPIHFHGHAFRVLSRNGRAVRRREWRDTVLMAPNESVEIGFVADNPGDWMIHCHILEHQAGGMMGVIRVV